MQTQQAVFTQGPLQSLTIQFTAAELATLQSAIAALPPAHPAVALLTAIASEQATIVAPIPPAV